MKVFVALQTVAPLATALVLCGLNHIGEGAQ